jgi:DNA-binding response OmpR family regulator
MSVRRILVADDEQDMVLTLSALLRAAGYETQGVYRGAEVAAAVQAFNPDVVLLDLAMPDRSGWEVARDIRAAGGDERPVLIAISGLYNQHAADRILGMAAEFDHYVAKPYDPLALLSLLCRL